MNVEIVKRSDYAKGFVVLSHGSVAVADWQGISKRPSPAQLPGRSSLTSASSQDGSQELENKHNHYESDTKTMMWSKHSRRVDPINRSAKPFCQGEAGAIGLSRMPMARSRRVTTAP